VSATNEQALREKYAPPMPDAVRRQKEAVERMLAQQNGDPASGTPDPAAPVGVQDGPPESGSDARADGADAAPADAGGASAVALPEGDSPAPSAPPADARKKRTEDGSGDSGESVESLRRRLAEATQEARTWKGRHNKTAEEQKALADKVAELEAKLREATRKPEPEIKELTAEELDAYGADLLDVAKRFTMPAVKELLEAALAPLRDRIADLERGVGNAQSYVAKTEWDRFLERLDARVPGWREVDTTEAFANWLDEEDQFFGLPRRVGLVKATEARDDVRVAKVFEAFFDQTKARSGRSRTAKRVGDSMAGTESGNVLTTAQTEPEPPPSLEAFAAPGRPAPSQAGSPPPRAGEKRIWTMAEVNLYYRARAKGEHPHSRDPAAASRMDEEIALANMEGRIRP
jgi:hypothetical protein